MNACSSSALASHPRSSTLRLWDMTPRQALRTLSFLGVAEAEQSRWSKMASTLSDDTAPSASLDHLEAQAAPTHPRAQPEPLGSLPWPQELASGRPKVEEFPLSTTRYRWQYFSRGLAFGSAAVS